MGAAQERQLRRRIKSIEATKKITRAMELIAASQIARAQERIAQSRPYQIQLAKALSNAVGQMDAKSKSLIKEIENPTSLLLLVIAGDRGLCGGYNNFVLRTAERMIKKLSSEQVKIGTVLVGKKAQAYFKFRKMPVIESFAGMTDRPNYQDAEKVSKALLSQRDNFETIKIVSTRFISPAIQKVEIHQLLPIPPEVIEKPESQIGPIVELEPEGSALIDMLVPQYIGAAVFSALLEASASEHTARQRAMSSATENAEELIKTLVRQMNRARQETITTEIMEIVGGAEALRAAELRRKED
jgi:F-type H+-transporting ATPase subunit gamma